MNKDEAAIRELVGQGLCCSQIMLAMGLALRGEENPAMMTAASGLCLGIHTGGVCGILTGAALTLSLFDSKNAASHMIPQFMEWAEESFTEQFGGPTCGDITDGKRNVPRCTELLIQSWAQAKGLLDEFGLIEPDFS